MYEGDLIIVDKFLSHQIDLFRFTAGERKRVLSLLEDMEKELVGNLANNNLTDFGKARANKLLKECIEAIDDYYKEIGKQIDLPGFVVNEAEFTAKTFVGIGLDASIPTQATMKALVSDTLLQGAPLKDWWAKQAEDTGFKFAAQVRQGIAQGETLQQIIIRVAGSKRLGTPGVMDIARRNASTLVHDSVMQVSNDARMATYQANSDIIKGYRQLSTLDSHTSKTCIAYSGAQWDINFKPINGTTLPFNGGCPRHPNCRSCIVPLTKTYRELGLNIDEKKPGTRSSDLGQIPADTTFADFLSRHSKDYQDELLGPGRAELWRKGTITLSDLVSGNGREFTLKELKAL